MTTPFLLHEEGSGGYPPPSLPLNFYCKGQEGGLERGELQQHTVTEVVAVASSSPAQDSCWEAAAFQDVPHISPQFTKAVWRPGRGSCCVHCHSSCSSRHGAASVVGSEEGGA